MGISQGVSIFRHLGDLLSLSRTMPAKAILRKGLRMSICWGRVGTKAQPTIMEVDTYQGLQAKSSA